MNRHLTRLFTGESIDRFYGFNLLRFTVRAGRMGVGPGPLSVS